MYVSVGSGEWGEGVSGKGGNQDSVISKGVNGWVVHAHSCALHRKVKLAAGDRGGTHLFTGSLQGLVSCPFLLPSTAACAGVRSPLTVAPSVFLAPCRLPQCSGRH